VRCFLAVPLQEPALADAQRLLHTLQESVVGVRWVRPETLHVTVHFFGSVSEEQAQAGVNAVRPVVERTSVFPVAADVLGSFPEHGRPRVLWLGAHEDQPAFVDLATACREALGRAGFETDARRFRAHCTLGRPRDPWPRESREAWRRAVEEPVRVREFIAARLVLYESKAAPGGHLYTERATLPLQP
jgi:RNA 2',3'-cyclic 3'-phosphodiesterase